MAGEWFRDITGKLNLIFRLPIDQRRNYRNVFHALIRIVRDEGVLALWRVNI